MSRFLLISFFTIACLNLLGQNYTPFPENSGYWKIQNSNCGICWPANFQCICGFNNYSINGDTTIGAFTYKKIYNYFQDDNYNIYPKYYTGAYRNDSLNKKVYFLPQNYSTDTLLYTYDLNIGDTLPVSYIHAEWDTMVVDSIVTETFNGHNYKRYSLYDVQAQTSIHSLIEGLGSTYGLFEPIITMFEEDNILLCFKYHNDSLAFDYYNFMFGWPVGDCHVVNSIYKAQGTNEEISIFPNPLIDQSIITFTDIATKTIKIYDLQGKLIKKIESRKPFIKLYRSDFTKGVYIIKVYSENKTYQNSKFSVN